MASYEGVDFLNIDSLLSDEELLVRRTVRQFINDRVMPDIEEWNREGKFPQFLIPEMAQLGFLGAAMKDYGGAGMNPVQGEIGSILGNGKINIANFALGRAQSSDQAIGVVNVDQEIPEPVLNEIRAVPAVRTARVIQV